MLPSVHAISGDDHDWGVIAQASGTASSSVR